jgi:hypothetical protein
VIAKVGRGKAVGGLVRYLFGPGRANEHTNPRVVAGWDEPGAVEPEITARGRRDFRLLIAKLNAPLAALNSATKCVWHCSLRSAPGDRALSDTEWADIAGEVMERTQLASPGDDGGCRWVAVRHAEDHVHLVATLARPDGRPAVLARNDFYRVGEACRAVEERYGLAITAGRDRTAAVRPTRAESEKAERLAKPAIAREVLRLEVQTAASGASGEEEFFARLEVAGVMVGKRYSERDPGQVTGYRVALPGSMGGLHSAEGKPIWYGGAKLAPDLSLPKLRAHWQASGGGAAGRDGGEQVSPRLRLRHEVEQAAAGARTPAEFFERLRGAGVLVRERFSQQRPDELTGYSVALASDRDAAGEVVWRGGGSLAPELSLPRLAARWGNGESAAAAWRPGARPITRLSGEERQQAWREARMAADNAAHELRRLGREDAAAGGDTARSAADLLHVAARAGEPNGKGPLHDAARAYDRASRTAYGRPARRSSGGAELRLAATTLALVARANRDDAAALVALVVALAGLVEAVAELRASQARSAQAAAARMAAEQLRAVAASRRGGDAQVATQRTVATHWRLSDSPPPPRSERGR